MKEDKRIKRKVRNSYMVSTVSIALVLLLLGSMSYVMIAAMKVGRTLQQSVVVTVELVAQPREGQIDSLKDRFSQMDEVVGMEFYSKDQKIKDDGFIDSFDLEIDDVLSENPLRDSYELSLSESCATDGEQIAKLRDEIVEFDGVASCYYPQVMIENLNSTVSKLRYLLAIFGCSILFISLVLLNNTIRLAIYSKRYLISTMKLVGATKWFIMKPFLWSSFCQGVFSGVVASLLLGATIYALNQTVPEVITLVQLQTVGYVVGGMIVAGVVITMLFTLFALNKFVNMRGNKIHLY